ncbi:MAG: hypothetical protein PHV53_04345 [Fermentimonas sp.]|nr:hypothetical protein [Fermentimonas sp.]
MSLGGDTDTLTCITGGIAEAFYGMQQSLPETTYSNHNPISFIDETMKKLPDDLSKTVKEFYDK